MNATRSGGNVQDFLGPDGRGYVSTVAIVLLVLESLYSFRAEAEYIWIRPFNKIKLLYAVTKIGTFISAVVLHTLTQIFLVRKSGAPSQYHCMVLFLFSEHLSCVAFTLFNCVLFFRVYALYRRSKRIAALILPFITAQYLLHMTILIQTIIDVSREIKLSESPFNALCDHQIIPDNVKYLIAVGLTCQGLMWVACFIRRNIASGESVVVHVVVQQGAWACALLYGLAGGLMPYAVWAQVSNPYILFLIPSVMISIVTCRLILHLQQLDFNDHGNIDDSQRFTSALHLTTFLALTGSQHANPNSPHVNHDIRFASNQDGNPKSLSTVQVC